MYPVGRVNRPTSRQTFDSGSYSYSHEVNIEIGGGTSSELNRMKGNFHKCKLHLRFLMIIAMKDASIKRKYV